MIDFLIGKVFKLNGVSITLLVNESIGYEVFIPLCYKGYNMGDVLKIEIAHIQKEDGRETLYGFFDSASKNFFKSLLTVDGIGDKKAFSILAKNTPIELMEMVNNKDLNAFKKVKGVGPKTAEKIIEKLEGKIILENSNSILNDLREALLTLGLNGKEIDSFLSTIDKSANYTVSELVTMALTK